MEVENRNVNPKLIEQIEQLKTAINEISVYDLNTYTAIELYYRIANKLNEVINELLRYEVVVSEQVVEQNNCLNYLLNNGLKEEVAKKLVEWYNDGSLAEFLSEQILTLKADKKFTPVVVNAGYFEIYKDDLTKDSTKGINDAISFCLSEGGGTVQIPSGKYLIEGSIIVPSEVILKGAGKCFNGGTILWRNENTNITNPFIILGSSTGGGATDLGGIKDFVIIGDSTVENIVAIKSNSVGFHGVSIKDIEIEYVKGTPIVLESKTEKSRVQFVEIKNVDIGFDFNTYKENVSPRTNNDKCGGVWLKGYVDGIYIDNCRFTNFINTSNMTGWLDNNTSYGVRIDTVDGITPQNNFVVRNSFFRGFKAGVYSEGKNITINDCYVEHCKSAFEFKAMDTSLLANVTGNHISGCEKGILYTDGRNSDYQSRSCVINIIGNNINWGVFNKSYLVDVIGTPNNSLIINIGANVLPNTWLSTKFETASNNAKPYVYGFTRHNNYGQKLILSSPRIIKEGDDKRGYVLFPNTDGASDFGLDIKDEDNLKMATFKKNGNKIYGYTSTGDRETVMEVDDRLAPIFAKGIILPGNGGKLYKIVVSEGQLSVNEI